MAAPPPWVNLTVTDALVREIDNRLPCEIDRVHFAAVCRPWRESLERFPPLPRPPALPSIILPLAKGPAISCILSDYATHPAVVPEWARYARYIGAYDDGWVFLSLAHPQGHEDHFLLDIYEFDHYIHLPNAFIVHQAGASGEVGQELLFPLSIVAATLSSYPDIEGCVFAGIVNVGPGPYGPPRVAFWRIFDQVVPVLFDTPEACWDVEDVVRHSGAFHFLTQGEHIIVGDPYFHDREPITPRVQWEFRYFAPYGRSYKQYVEARYLVVSRGDLLMVVRCSPNPGELTSEFKVFRMVRAEQPAAIDGAVQFQHYIWRELPSLEGRMLFVGHGCSRSYEADQYPGFKGGIYFFDDRAIHGPVMLQQGGALLYHCNDSGKWTGAPPQVERCFPSQAPSSYSPQGWCLP